MILSIEAFIKQTNCVNCGKLAEATESLCKECSELLRKADIEKMEERQSNLIDEEANNDSNDS